MALDLQIAALRDDVASVTVNGQEPKSAWVQGEVGLPRLEIGSDPAARIEIVVTWKGNAPKPNIRAGCRARRAGKGRRRLTGTRKFRPTKNLKPSISRRFSTTRSRRFSATNTARRVRRFASLATPNHGIGGWCEPTASFDVDDSGLRALAAKNGGKIILPDGISFATPGESGAKNIIFTSQWDNYPREVSVPLAGKSSHAFLLMAGSTAR